MEQQAPQSNDPTPQPAIAAGPGMILSLELVGTGEVEPLRVIIVPDEKADFSHGYLGETTPLAKAVLGKMPGEEIPYNIADIHTVRIVSVTPGAKPPPPSLIRKRRSILQKAAAEAERTNAIIFASSFSGKWGDYDPDGLKEKNW